MERYYLPENNPQFQMDCYNENELLVTKSNSELIYNGKLENLDSTIADNIVDKIEDCSVAYFRNYTAGVFNLFNSLESLKTIIPINTEFIIISKIK
jgi:hypothetical protein